MDQVLNELSLSGIHETKYDAFEPIRKLCQASKSLESLGFTSSIRTVSDIGTRKIAKNYTFGDFLKDKNIPAEYRTERSLILKRCTSNPCVENLCNENGMAELEEYKFSNELCYGLALAHIWRVPALTYGGDRRFSDHVVRIAKFSIESGELKETEHSVLIVQSGNCVETHKDKIHSSILPGINCGADILTYASSYFTYLEFCGSAPLQLKQILCGDMHLPTIIRILQNLDKEMHKSVISNTGRFFPDSIYYTQRESDTVRQSKKLRKQREFKCKDGIKRFFEEHVRISQGKRIQIYSDVDAKKVHIGHIGEHLQTAKF